MTQKICILLLSFVFSIQAFAQNALITDNNPSYKKWKDNYEITKIEYTPKTTVIYFKFKVLNGNGVSAIFYPVGSPNAWMLRDKKHNTNYALRAIRNIRLNGLLLVPELRGKEEFFIDDSRGYNEFTCEVVFDRVAPNTLKVDLLEGFNQRQNKNHFHCLNIKVIPSLTTLSN